MKNFDAIILDMDGLLLDTERPAFEAFRSTCSKFQLGDLSSLFRQCIGTNPETGTAILKKGLDGLVDPEVFRSAWREAYRKAAGDGPAPLKNGVREFLSRVEKNGTPLALATSSPVESARRNLRRSGILHYFTHIVGGDQVTRSKPDPEIYLKAASGVSADPANCLAVEDSANGVRAAVAAGMTVVQIPDLVYPNEALLSLGHIVLENILNILEYEFPSKRIQPGRTGESESEREQS